MKQVLILVAIAFGTITVSNAQINEIKVEPKGIFKEIDVARHNETVGILKGENKKLKQQTVENIMKNPNYYNPPVLFALSRELYNQDKKDEATFWFYVAQLRARFDANLCMDETALQGVSILNSEFGPDINKYAMQDIDNLEKTVTKVVDFVKTNEENYDHRWLNLHGMDAMSAGLSEDEPKQIELSKPKEKWVEIKMKTLNDYYNGFIQYVKNRKK